MKITLNKIVTSQFSREFPPVARNIKCVIRMISTLRDTMIQRRPRLSDAEECAASTRLGSGFILRYLGHSCDWSRRLSVVVLSRWTDYCALWIRWKWNKKPNLSVLKMSPSLKSSGDWSQTSTATGTLKVATSHFDLLETAVASVRIVFFLFFCFFFCINSLFYFDFNNRGSLFFFSLAHK